MKRSIYIIMCLVCFAPKMSAQSVDGVSIKDCSMSRDGGRFVVDMTMDMRGLDVSSNRAVVLTPRLVHGNDSIDLQSVGVYGRRRYYYYVRNGESLLTGRSGQSYRAAEKPDTVSYHAAFAYQDWMDGAVLKLNRTEWGCCGTLIAEQDSKLATHYGNFMPRLVYVRPEGTLDPKTQTINGSAYIDFPVDKTKIYPEYRRNTAELAKIRATIDSVRGDSDYKIMGVWLKGYASPESPYSHNEMLAKGRTEALKQYIQQLYRFDSGVISTDYEPEDWAGLRRYVESSNINNRTEILALIDGDREPDAKEWLIKSRYPESYRFLLQNCYPALRHTDYRVTYTIRTFTDINEIKRLMKTQPQKLSMNDFYAVAQEYEVGSDEFKDAFDTAVRLFPGDPTANLNAANSAMSRGDMTSAARYLDRAGQSAEAIYARGVYAIMQKDYATGRTLMTEASKMGLKYADETLKELAKRE